MKTLKYFLSVIILITAVVSCVEEDFGNADFINSAVAPTDVTATFDVTQDNTGLVTITPNGEGAVNYTVDFGDGSDEETVNQGDSVEHTFAEGSYDVVILAKGITGLTTEVTIPLVVSFSAPENLEVVITNDEAVSKQVNVTATADYAITFDVYFGEEGNDDPVSGNIGETVTYIYAEPGTYTITVEVKGAAIDASASLKEIPTSAVFNAPQSFAPSPTIQFMPN